MSSPAGWHPDPYRQAELRWWDGQGWTDQVHPPVAPRQALDVPALIPAPQIPDAQQPSQPALPDVIELAPVLVPAPAVRVRTDTRRPLRSTIRASSSTARRADRKSGRVPARTWAATALAAAVVGLASRWAATDLALPVAAALTAGAWAERRRPQPLTSAATAAVVTAAGVLGYGLVAGDARSLRYLGSDGDAQQGALALALTALAVGLVCAWFSTDRPRAVAWSFSGAAGGLLTALAVQLALRPGTPDGLTATGLGVAAFTALALCCYGASRPPGHSGPIVRDDTTGTGRGGIGAPGIGAPAIGAPDVGAREAGTTAGL